VRACINLVSFLLKLRDLRLNLFHFHLHLILTVLCRLDLFLYWRQLTRRALTSFLRQLQAPSITLNHNAHREQIFCTVNVQKWKGIRLKIIITKNNTNIVIIIIYEGLLENQNHSIIKCHKQSDWYLLAICSQPKYVVWQNRPIVDVACKPCVQNPSIKSSQRVSRNSNNNRPPPSSPDKTQVGMLNDYRKFDYRIKCSFSFSFVSHSILDLLIFFPEA